MSKREKLRRKLKNNPKNATLQEVTTLLGYFGFVLARIVGSHHVFRYDHDEVVRTVVVPVHGRKVRVRYTQEAIDAIDELFPPDEEKVDEE